MGILILKYNLIGSFVMNIFETLKDIFAPLMDGEKNPLHVGEVMHLWSFLDRLEMIIRVYQIAYNTTEDPELKDKLNELINQVNKPIVEELKAFLIKEGVPLPKNTPEKPLSSSTQKIHAGVKLTDEEMANLMAYNLVEDIRSAVLSITDAARVDVALMFAKFQMKMMNFSITLKPLMEKRGWLNEPIYYK
jgi:hypothetical protein